VLRTHWLTSSAAAKAYFRQSDYYAATPGEWLGKGAERLGLHGPARAEDFDKLCDNLNPRTGLPLTTYTRDNRRVGMDLTFSSTKSVGIVRELAGPGNAGDPKVEEAHREAVAYAMRFIEADMRARVRVSGQDEDRVTGNLIAYRVTHRDTRISAEDQKPDMSLHDHVFVLNATYDSVEGKWKAAQMGQIKHDAPWYEAIYHNRLASNLRTLGYGIRRKEKAFEINGVSDDLVKKFSRRRKYIKAVAAKLGITSQAGFDKLGATTRLGKAKELADDLNGYFSSRLTDKEKQQLADLKGKPSYLSNDRDAVQFAIGHMFERKSVVDEKRLYEAAIRQGIGSVTPEGVHAESCRQGVLLRDGEATTRDVLAEETRVIDFARQGRGTCRPLGSDHICNATKISDLSAEQAAIARHVWDNRDQVIMIRGAAGTGKTHTMKATIAGIDKPVVVLAPSAEASRGVLRKEGFAEADTVARFLQDEQFQNKAKNGVIWVDEAGLLGIRQVRQVFDIADHLEARVVLQGDRRQHGSIERGATLRVLEEYAGLPVAELRDIRRQRGEYKQAVEALSKGDILAGCDKLHALGWVRHLTPEEGNKPLVDEYLAGLKAGKEMLVVAPTHVEGDEITGEIRAKLKVRGVVSRDEQTVEVLRQLGWTDAEKGDVESYDGTETLQYHRNSGSFRAGQQVRVKEWLPSQRIGNPKHFSVYTRTTISIASGDIIRITTNGHTRDRKHKLNNGSQYTVKAISEKGEITLSNGWVVGADFGHLAHGFVSTSHASQGRTVDRVLIAMGSESLPAMSAEQFYVSISRGRESARVYSNLPSGQLRDAIQRTDSRKSATELIGRPKPRLSSKRKILKFMARARTVYHSWKERAARALHETVINKEREHGR